MTRSWRPFLRSIPAGDRDAGNSRRQSIPGAASRAQGRQRWNALQRDRAEARRLQVRKRLPGLQKEAWAAYPEGVIPRVTTGGILHGSLAALADELGVDRV